MTNPTSSTRSIIIVLTLSASLLPGLALAGGPAFSGIVAQADSAESAFASPAGMSRLEDTNITVQGMLAAGPSKFEVDDNLTTIDGGDPDKGSDPVAIPSFYYVRQLNDKWHAGASLTIPSGFGSNYGNTWAGRYQTVDFSLVYIALTPAVSYRVNDSLSLGAAVGINYTSETSETKLIQPGSPDGKIKSDLDGIGVNVTLSALYEFTDRTRAGIAWTSDSDADLEGKIRLRQLSPPFDEVADERGLGNIDTEITNTLPQRVLAGVYHEFESGNYFTVDAMWMKFSDFSVSDIKLNGNDVDVDSPNIYDDIWALTVGAGFPAGNGLTYTAGAMYLSQAVDDEDRTFSMRIDSLWGAGAGVTYELTPERSVDFNATFLRLGDAPVDTETVGRRIVGETKDPYAMLLELTYHF